MFTKLISQRTHSDSYRVLRVYKEQLMSLLENGGTRSFLDLGCGSGLYTSQFAQYVKASRVVGVDIDTEALRLARDRGIETVKADLNSPLPFPDESFDTIVSSQVIEHLTNPDSFAGEIHRLLTRDGHAVIATENLAAWHNILSLLLGYQPFTENISTIRRIGNPLAPHYGEVPRFDNLHVKVFTLRSFLEFLEVHDFEVCDTMCSGYPPIPHPLSNLLSRIDPRHSRYMIVRVRKNHPDY